MMTLTKKVVAKNMTRSRIHSALELRALPSHFDRLRWRFAFLALVFDATECLKIKTIFIFVFRLVLFFTLVDIFLAIALSRLSKSVSLGHKLATANMFNI